ncbi:MAG TPA: hypothetical protein VF884_12490 [Nitrososphaeraceae archaeon]
MSKHQDKPSSYSPHMRGVALGLLVMGLSLTGIIIAYVSFGHVGPKFSAELLVSQQASLRKEFGLTPKPVITNESLLLVPPSLRNATQNNHSS